MSETFTTEKFKYYSNEIYKRDLKKVYQQIKNIEVLSMFLLEWKEELKKELYI